ncbi:MAG: hypothetical protein RLY93_02060 [Sumerlaeia bacterium]
MARDHKYLEGRDDISPGAIFGASAVTALATAPAFAMAFLAVFWRTN